MKTQGEMAYTFAEMLDDLFKKEGGYVYNKNDRGGETNFGITKTTALDHGYRGEMKDLPIEIARRIYKNSYWSKPRINKLYDMSLFRTSRELFFTAVHCGPRRAIKFLQRSLNCLSLNERDFKHLDVDGLWGPATQRALGAFIRRRKHGPADIALRKLITANRVMHYVTLCERDPKQEVFFYGWTRR